MLILLVFIFYVITSYSMDSNQSPPLAEHYTYRLHINSHPEIQHYSFYNKQRIITWIITPNLRVMKKTFYAWTIVLTTYEVWKHTQKIEPIDGRLLFKQLKQKYALAEEPTFESLFATQPI